ncbi:acylphosphatase [archaeon]|nr:acylphosphatase [archaeon]
MNEKRVKKMMLNKRIVIEGEKVHNVGYRPFLLWKACELGIPNYDAKNVEEEGKQMMIVSFGGEENQLKSFIEFVKENYPPRAKVSGVSEDEPPERVMSMDSYIKFLHVEQLYELAHIPQIYKELKNVNGVIQI